MGERDGENYLSIVAKGAAKSAISKDFFSNFRGGGVGVCVKLVSRTAFPQLKIEPRQSKKWIFS